MISEAKYKIFLGNGRPSDLVHKAKVFDRSHLKILTPKQMSQRLLIALAQVKAVIHLKKYITIP